MAKKKTSNKIRKRPKKKNKNITKFFLFLVAFIIVLFLALRLARPVSKKPIVEEKPATVTEKPQKTKSDRPLNPRRSLSFSAENQIYYFAEEFGILKRLVSITQKKESVEVHLPVNPATTDLNYTNFKLTRYLRSLGWEQISGKESNNQRVQTLNFATRKDKAKYSFLIYYDDSNSYPPQKRRVSIVVKGFGTMTSVELDKWLKVKESVCFAVLPVSRLSRTNILSIVNAGFEALIQLPLEDPGFPAVFTPEYAIFGHFKDSEVTTKLDHYFRLLPRASGVITHQGGLITTDTRIMPIILNYIKQKHLYFIDDKAIETSIAFSMAQDIVLTSYEKSVSFQPSAYKNDSNGAKLKNDIRSNGKDPLIITLQKNDDETFVFLGKLIEAVKSLDLQIVAVSELGVRN